MSAPAVRTWRRATPEEKARAKQLIDSGMTYTQVGAVLGRHRQVVFRWVHPGAEERNREINRGYAARHSNGPRKCSLNPEKQKRKNLRQAARTEARITGEDVSAIYERWGCA